MWSSSSSAEWRCWKRAARDFSSAGLSWVPYVAWMFSPRMWAVG